jgi:hypothetical protein
MGDGLMATNRKIREVAAEREYRTPKVTSYSSEQLLEILGPAQGYGGGGGGSPTGGISRETNLPSMGT